jgi:hypothetical protein
VFLTNNYTLLRPLFLFGWIWVWVWTWVDDDDGYDSLGWDLDDWQ